MNFNHVEVMNKLSRFASLHVLRDKVLSRGLSCC